MKTSSPILPVALVIGVIVLLYYFLKNQSANSGFIPYGPGGYNPFSPNVNPGYGPGGYGSGVSTWNPGYSLSDLFGPGPNMSSGGVGNGGAVDPSVNTGADFNGSEGDPEGAGF